MRERLQKILARAGFGSRRACERLITEGRVQVDGVTVRELGTAADPDTSAISVDGQPLRLAQQFLYLVAHKPAGLITTAADERGRDTVFRLLPPSMPARVFPVGRLDRDTEGLLLFTNDGELAFRLTHPRYGVEKEYLALVPGPLDDDAIARLRSGVEIEGRRTAPARVTRARGPGGEGEWVRLVIHEGRKRQVRWMLAVVGQPARRLIRVRFGPVRLDALPPGAVRELTLGELRSLAAATNLVRPRDLAL